MPLYKSSRLQFTATKKLLSTDHVNDYFGFHFGSGEISGGFASSPSECLGLIILSPFAPPLHLESGVTPGGGREKYQLLCYILLRVLKADNTHF